ncbi:MAG: hypothetical protein GXO64_03350 [Candidatus Micrarchaeota archaeon]|nr:hypothetical protein [Candidatus Micrarchaeota archaeon]
MKGKNANIKRRDFIPAFGNGFLDAAFSALRREMEFFDMSFDNENITTIYDKRIQKD